MNETRPRPRRGTVRVLRLVLPASLGFLGASCDAPTQPVLTTWEGDLLPVLPSNVSGQVAAVTQFGRTEVSIQIRNGEPAVVYGWRIETGTCQGTGLIQDGPAVYPLLEASEGGSASGATVLTSIFKPGATFSAKVYRSDEGSERIVSCGDLDQVF